MLRTTFYTRKLTSRKPISLSSIWTLANSRRFPYKSGYWGGDFGRGGGKDGTEAVLLEPTPAIFISPPKNQHWFLHIKIKGVSLIYQTTWEYLRNTMNLITKVQSCKWANNKGRQRLIILKVRSFAVLSSTIVVIMSLLTEITNESFFLSLFSQMYNKNNNNKLNGFRGSIVVTQILILGRQTNYFRRTLTNKKKRSNDSKQ